MKVDIGFWDSQGNYISDIQEVNEVEMDKEKIIDCPHINFNDWGGYSCKLYNPNITDDKKKFVKYGTCESNDSCIYKQLKRLEYENAELKAENERLKEENEKLNKMTGIFSARLCKKYRTTLQEIKAIAETPKPFIDFSETKTAIEVEYDYAAICNELELRLYKVLELITKAEEE